MTRASRHSTVSPEIIAQVEQAESYLCDHDPRLRAVIRDLGPCKLASYLMEPFDALVWTVVGQQISSAAAASITNRLRQLAGGLFTADALSKLGEDELRGAGLSRNKIRTITELSAKVLSTEIDLEVLADQPDEVVMKQLCQHYGIGPWTVEMFLIFGLSRMDVFSGGDLALRKAIGLLYDHDTPPDIQESNRLAENWAPYRTVASWYLWRTVDPLA
jgi:DNA-3-methyladenine glycosylase II